jgi:hypothetical protein
MAWRCNEADIRDLIDSDDPDARVAPFINTANTLVDRLEAKDTDEILSSAILIEIERYLSAHFYEHKDPQFSQEKTGDASATYQGEFGMGFNSTKWGQTAKMLDETGFLASLDKPKIKAGVTWLGKPHSEQTPYDQRD